MKKLILYLLLFLTNSAFAQQLHLFPDVVIEGRPIVNAIFEGEGYYLVSSQYMDYIDGKRCGNLVKIDLAGDIVPSFTRVVANNHILSAVPLADGKILVAGWFKQINGTEASVMRLNANGEIDNSFKPFIVGQYEEVSRIALQPDGKIIVAGDFRKGAYAELIRLLPDGTIDNSFASNENWSSGFLTTPMVAVDGSIFVSDGHHVFKLSASGVKQPGFPVAASEGGYFYSFQRYGNKFIAAGVFDEFAGQARKNLVVINEDGSVDPLQIDTPPVESVTVLSGNRLMISGESGVKIYNESGQQIHELPVYTTPVIVNKQQQLIGFAASHFTNWELPWVPHRLMKWNPDFTPDPSFDCTLTHTNDIRAIASQPDGRILIAVPFGMRGPLPWYNTLQRISLDGTVDEAFMSKLPLLSTVYALATQPDGKILVASSRLVRLNASGSIDNTFEVPPSVNTEFNKIVLREEGIYAGGATLIRVLENGSVDPSFTSQLPESVSISDFAFQSDDRIIVAGYFDGGTKQLIRLNANGSLDNSFADHAYNGVRRIAVDSNDRIYMAGDFVNYNGTDHDKLVRLLPNGEIDNTFNPVLPFDINSSAMGLELLSDNEILVGAYSPAVVMLDAFGNTLDNPYSVLADNSTVLSSHFNGETLYVSGRLEENGNTNVSGFSYLPIHSIQGSVDDLVAERKTSTKAQLQWNDLTAYGRLIIIERTENNNLNFTPVDTIAMPLATYTDSGLNPASEYYYRVRAINTNSSTAYSNEAHVDLLAITGLENNDASSAIVYPNPGTGRFHIALPDSFEGGTCIISGSNGMHHDARIIHLDNGLFDLDLEKFTGGLYMLTLQQRKQTLHVKVIKW